MDQLKGARMEADEVSQSEKHFREMADNAPMMVWVTEPDGVCTFLSESWYRFTGQQKHEGLGYGWVNAVHPDDRARVKEAFVQANAQKSSFRVEYRLRRADGRFRWALDSATPRRGAGGAYLGYIGSVIDITERRKAEKLEAGQREVLELIAKDAPLRDVFDSLVRMVENLATSPLAGAICLTDAEGRHAAHERPRESWSVPIVGSDGRALGRFAIHRHDASDALDHEDQAVVEVAARTAGIAIERAAARAALQVSRERLDLVIEASQVGVWYCDLPFSELIWDQRVKEHFWLPPDARVTIELFYERLHPDDRETTRKAIEKSISEHSHYDIEYRTVSPAGEVRWVRAIGRGFYDREGKPFRFDGVTLDITQNKTQETELRESAERLRQAEATLEKTVAERTAKLKESIADLEAFSYSVSHDLRSPLRAMQGYADELLKEAATSLSPTHRGYLDRIQRAAARLDRLTQDILSYSRLSNAEIQLQPVSVANIVEQIIDQYPHLRDSGAQIEVQSPLDAVIGNEALLTQALSNLMNNAVKFVAPGGLPRITISTESADQFVKIIVADNGIGIEPRHYDRIFQIFGRVYPESKFPGTGIGLAIVKKSAERMRGGVGFDSEPGLGSRFWIALPKPSQTRMPEPG